MLMKFKQIGIVKGVLSIVVVIGSKNLMDGIYLKLIQKEKLRF